MLESLNKDKKKIYKPKLVIIDDPQDEKVETFKERMERLDKWKYEFLLPVDEAERCQH